jgi:hypothetical protein
MGQHKKRSAKGSQVPPKQPPRQGRHNQVSWKTAVHRALSSGWVQNSGILFFATLIALIVAMGLRIQVKAAALTFALTGTLAIWIFAVAMIKNAADENPPFGLFIQTAVIGDKRGTPLFGEYNRTYLAQIEFILYVKLTNKQSTQATISDLNVEVMRKKGWWILPDRWMATTPIYRGVRLIWVNPPPRPSQLIELQPGRLEPVLDRALAPHETVEGCILLDVGKEWLSAPRPPLYRFSIRDTADNKAVIIDDASHGGNVGNAIDFHAIGDVDVSRHTIVHLADSRN